MTGTLERLAAVILAAGYSRRLGRFKPLLPRDGSTVIERAMGSFLQAGVTDVRVVVGHEAAELEPALGRLGVEAIFNIGGEHREKTKESGVDAVAIPSQTMPGPIDVWAQAWLRSERGTPLSPPIWLSAESSA